MAYKEKIVMKGMLRSSEAREMQWDLRCSLIAQKAPYKILRGNSELRDCWWRNESEHMSASPNEAVWLPLEIGTRGQSKKLVPGFTRLQCQVKEF